MSISKMSIDNARALIAWLEDDRQAAAEHDPSVGVFGNDELAQGFDELIAYVEEKMESGKV